MSPPIYTPDGSEVTEIVLPDGSTASEVVAPDGSVVFEAGPDIPDSVIHRYTFENNGDTATLTDSVGSADGTISGMTYTTSQADDNYAGEFASDDEVTIPASEPAPISFCFDAYPRSDGAMVSWGFDFGNDQGIAIKTTVNDELQIIYGGSGAITTASLSLNTRQHIAVTVSDTDDITVYFDGVQDSSATGSNSGWGGNSALGSESGSNYGDVILDDVDVDNKVLSQTEVQSRID